MNGTERIMRKNLGELQIEIFAGVSRKPGPVQASTTCGIWTIKHPKFGKRSYVGGNDTRP